MTKDELAELKRANDLQERTVDELRRIADKPLSRNFLQTISDWWAQEKAISMQRNY